MKKLLLSAILLIAFNAMAQNAGDLFTTFGTNGKTTTNVGLVPYVVKSQAIQSDGKILLAGDFGDGFIFKSFVARLTTNGDLDTSFNGTGIIVDNNIQELNKIESLNNGNFFIAGTDFDGINYIVCYNNDGTLNNGFASGGILTLDQTTFTDYLIKEAISDVNDNIYFLTQKGSNSSHIIGKITANGVYDTTFDSDGIVSFTLGYTNNPTKMAIQADGKIVVAGEYYSFPTAGTNGCYLIRFNTSGTMDSGFNSTGTKFIVNNNMIDSLAIQPDQKIVVLIPASNQITVYRLNTNGTNDTTFDTDGNMSFTNNFNGPSYADFVCKSQTDGKLIIVGATNVGTVAIPNNNILIARLNTNGSLDTSFDADGKLTVAIGTLNDYAFDFDIYNNKIIAGGNMFQTQDIVPMCVVSVNTTNGSLDTSFNSDGKATVLLTNETSNTSVTSILQADGKIIVGGTTIVQNNYTNFLNYHPCLTRYNADGSLDTTFGTNGQIIVNREAKMGSMAQQSDGKFVIVSDGTVSVSEIIRINTNGTLDTTFGGDGVVHSFYDFSWNAYLSQVIVLPNGKILIAGQIYNDTQGNMDFLVARLFSNGALDTSFGSGGSTSEGSSNNTDGISSMILQTDGKIVAGGYVNNGSDDDLALVRYSSNGIIDTTFNGNGVFTTSISPSVDESANQITQQTDGKLVTCAFNYDGSVNNFALVRVDTDGTLDPAFDSDGIVLNAFGSNSAISYGVKMSNQKIMAYGTVVNGSSRDFGVARFNLDGTADTGFGTNGIALTDFNGKVDVASNALLTTDDKIIVTGSAVNPLYNNYDFALAKYYLTTDLSTHENQKEAFTIYPNPTIGIVYVQPSIVSAGLFTLEGKQISTELHNGSIDLSTYSKGMYLLKMTDANGNTETQKVIKQ